MSGKVVQALAPRFGGTGEEAAAMKFAARSPTAVRPAGVSALAPPLSILALPGLHGLCTLCRGAPVVAGMPGDRALVSTLSLVICAVATNILAVLVISPLPAI